MHIFFAEDSCIFAVKSIFNETNPSVTDSYIVYNYISLFTSDQFWKDTADEGIQSYNCSVISCIKCLPSCY